MPYDTVVVTDFADLECEASAKSVAVCAATTTDGTAADTSDTGIWAKR